MTSVSEIGRGEKAASPFAPPSTFAAWRTDINTRRAVRTAVKRCSVAARKIYSAYGKTGRLNAALDEARAEFQKAAADYCLAEAGWKTAVAAQQVASAAFIIVSNEQELCHVAAE
jgi:hypothetical protein